MWPTATYHCRPAHHQRDEPPCKVMKLYLRLYYAKKKTVLRANFLHCKIYLHTGSSDGVFAAWLPSSNSNLRGLRYCTTLSVDLPQDKKSIYQRETCRIANICKESVIGRMMIVLRLQNEPLVWYHSHAACLYRGMWNICWSGKAGLQSKYVNFTWRADRTCNRHKRVLICSGCHQPRWSTLHWQIKPILATSRRYSTWEPEEHILDQRLVQAYEEK